MWGWTSYRRTGWCDGYGNQLYRARLTTRGDADPDDTWDECIIVFCAKRPVLALRAICDSGTNPLEFHGKFVDA